MTATTYRAETRREKRWSVGVAIAGWLLAALMSWGVVVALAALALRVVG